MQYTYIVCVYKIYVFIIFFSFFLQCEAIDDKKTL